jgi:hypothetical protein
MLPIFCLALAGCIGADVETAEAKSSMEGLQRIQELVGQWEGSGKSEKSGGWDEKIDCRWQFDTKGQGSIRLTFQGKGAEKSAGLLTDGVLTYDPEKESYRLQAKAPGGKTGATLTFVGKAKTATNLILTRTSKGAAKDELDRIDLKILNEGDRIVYSFQRRLGKGEKFRPVAQVGLDRVGRFRPQVHCDGRRRDHARRL